MFKNTNNLCSVCGCTLRTQTGVKIVAVFQIICTSLLFLIVGYFLVSQGIKVNDFSSRTGQTPGNVSIAQNVTLSDGQVSPQTTFRIFIAFLIIFAIMGIFLLVDIQLLKGANQKIVGKCSVWCNVRLVRTIFAWIIFMAGFYKNQIQPLQSFVGVEIILNLCCMFIVQKFIKELSSDDGDKDWRQSSINSNASSSSDTPWFTSSSSTTTTPTDLEDDVFVDEEPKNMDKEKRRHSKEKSVTFDV